MFGEALIIHIARPPHLISSHLIPGRTSTSQLLSHGPRYLRKGVQLITVKYSANICGFRNMNLTDVYDPFWD